MSEENQVADAPVDTGQAASEGTTEFNFRDHIDESIRDDPSLSTYKDINGMAKSLINAQKMVGADKVAIPGKYTTPEEMDSFYSKIGRPDTADGYELSSNEVIGDEGVTFFRELAHKNGLTQTQAENILTEYGGYIDTMGEKTEEQIEQIRVGLEKDLQNEWGDQYEKNIGYSNEVVSFFGSDEDAITEMKLADGTRIGDNPMIIEMFSNIGQFIAEKIGEDSFSGRDNVPGMATEEVQQELNSIMAPGTPYWDKQHPDHNRVVQRALQLNGMLTGDAA